MPTPLQIKVNSLKRLRKEFTLYKAEVAENEALLASMNSNEYEAKKQAQVVDESKRMVVELQQKIDQHTQRLRDFLKDFTGDEDLTEAQLLVA